MTIIQRISRKLRILIAGMFAGHFTKWYSTIDNPSEVPVQKSAYEFAARHVIKDGDLVLDVGFGLGYGFHTMATEKTVVFKGIDIDAKAVKYVKKKIDDIQGLSEIIRYDGVQIPYPDRSFDCVTCIDVLEHVPDYLTMIEELIRVCRRSVLISTPNRRPEFTRSDGKPKNRWHIREWSYEEFDSVLKELIGVDVSWHFLDGPWEGPFNVSRELGKDTLAMVPVLHIR